MDQVKCVGDSLKKFEGYDLLTADHISSNFERLSSTNLTWFILEYFVPSHVNNKTNRGHNKKVNLVQYLVTCII